MSALWLPAFAAEVQHVMLLRSMMLLARGQAAHVEAFGMVIEKIGAKLTVSMPLIGRRGAAAGHSACDRLSIRRRYSELVGGRSNLSMRNRPGAR